ncbi:MAG: type II secretion system protein GspM [Armatimonadota bacterium]
MTGRDRRVLLWGFAAVTAAVLMLRVIPWAVRAYGGLRVRAVERVETLARARTAVAATAMVRDSLSRAATELVALAPKLLPGKTAAEAAANLGAAISGAAERSGMRVIALNPTADAGSGLFVPVSTHARLEGDLAALAGFLRTVELGRPVLTIRNLPVQAADPRSQDGTRELLRVELDVTGWRIQGEGPST